MDIDEQLINQNTESQEAEKAGEFRATTRGGVSENNENGSSLRELVQQKKVQEAKDNKDKDGNGLLSQAMSPVLKSTDEALKFAWENLIDSFGLTLLWIDIHYFLNKVFGPTMFRELGEEWIPDSVKKSVGDSKQAAGLLKIVEQAGCGCLNLGCLFLILAIVSLIAMIVSGISNPMEVIKALFGSLWNWFTGGK